MTDKVYVVTDLGPGDGGKGGVVHKVVTMLKAHTVIKRGGAQGSHGVRTAAGQSFAFSQWGCGTFEGIPTHISQQMIVSAEGLLNEASALRYGHGIHDPWSLLTVDERALVATPFHGIASRLKELARGDKPRGTIGTGVGEAYRYLQWQPELAITAGELTRPDLPDRLAAVRDQIRRDLEPVIEQGFLKEDLQLAADEVDRLDDDGFLAYVTKRFQEAASLTPVVDAVHLGEEILTKPGVAVVESSHGVLTDRLMGFYPHSSAIRTLPWFTHKLLAESGFTGQTINLGVSRAYAIRHGAGPLPTNHPEMAEHLLPGSHKDDNRWQGKVRVGPLDMVLLRYAIAACGGPKVFDGLAITWFDQIVANGIWYICPRYVMGTGDQAFFSSSGDINVSSGAGTDQLGRQAMLGQQLLKCVPDVQRLKMPSGASTMDDFYGLCAETVEATVNVPVRMVSFGPTEREKLCK